jgi:hypothetical protein
VSFQLPVNAVSLTVVNESDNPFSPDPVVAVAMAALTGTGE